MQLDKYEIENLLERFGDMIDDGDWEKLFMNLFRDYDPETIGAISTFFYESDVNYLEDMDYIPPCAFYESDLVALTIPNSIKRIEDYAFANSKLSSITIPKTVEEISETAFYNCKDLIEVKYNGTKDAWYDLGARLPRQTKVNFK